ncbi:MULTISPECIES: hypothetical protein [Rhodococcus]|jgi:hypothetical protein|uniref:hypothetical protein n=1 Tax=Rhodococcus TaxID=1827 RepID=UPI0004C341CD|nr:MULTISPECIES: hypothetical protein [Rhodococcus]MBW0285998.1 hypothetical protein [Rhodococcus sp. FH8]MCJ0950383.1 hypothetical protein [Rhodococcus sp. ARC_M8]QEX10858.1 hypothetical protein F6X56_14615 [Rhodococcus erythropolis]UKO88870.1 hypothetical protein ITJ47_14125 [Rhodococcus erythropolis]BBE45448.1 hypothetical protein RE2895_23790 [Rhodococcus erythropolis]
MAHNGPESLPNQPCIDHLADTVDLRADIAKLALILAFEDTFSEVDERLITREEALVRMEALAPHILHGAYRGGAA